MLSHDISPSLTSYLSCNFNCYVNHKLLVNSSQLNRIEHNVKRFFSITPWMSGSTINYYELLELSENCSRKDIKKAFTRLSKLHHPDAIASRAAASGSVPPLSTNKFLAINEAYQTLSNPVKRQEYDERLRFENRFSAYTTVRPPFSNQYHPRPQSAESEQFANRPFSFYQAQYMRPESYHGPPPSAASLRLEAFIQKRLFFIIGIAFVISSLFQYSRIRTYKWLQLASDRHRHLHRCQICEYGGSCVRESRVNIAPYNFMHYVEALLRTQQAAHSAPDARASAGGDAQRQTQMQTQMQSKPSPETLEAARLHYEQELERLSARVLHVMHQRYFLEDAVEVLPSSPLVLEALDGAGTSAR